MNTKICLYPCMACILCGLLALSTAVHAQGQFRLSSGATYTTGDYGTDTRMDVWYVPLTARFDYQRFRAQFTVPWMQITRKGDGVSRTDEGLGDVLGTLRFRLINEGDYMPQVAVSGRVRFATADEDLGLVDENTYYGQLELAKRIALRTSIFGSVGYQTRSESRNDAGRDERYYGAIGLNYQFTRRTSAGAMVNARQAWDVDAVDEVGYMAIPYITHNFDGAWRLQTYAIAGLSKTAPDWGGGFSLGYDF